ncbi:MAG: hypothetical protein K8H88_23365 [Sandaracinaceae bacterium]|nr:hypothetical protein [Sandaracinaceae bacterium]
MSIYDPDVPPANIYWILGELPVNPFVESGDPEADDSQSDGDPEPDERATREEPEPEAPTPAPPGTTRDARSAQNKNCPFGTFPVDDVIPVLPEDVDCIVNATFEATIDVARLTRTTETDLDAIARQANDRNDAWAAAFRDAIARCPEYSGTLGRLMIEGMARASQGVTTITAGDGSTVTVDQAGVSPFFSPDSDPKRPTVIVVHCR